jgi:hypothetical protein
VKIYEACGRWYDVVRGLNCEKRREQLTASKKNFVAGKKWLVQNGLLAIG